MNSKPINPIDVSKIRSRIRNARKAVDEQTRQAWSDSASSRTGQIEAFKNSKRVGAFQAFDGEADPVGLMSLAIEQDKQVYVPIIVGKGKPLRFAPWYPDVEMMPNRFGIDEPVGNPEHWIDAEDLDFVVAPLVAFDQQCNRIGVGGGYYDRSFAFLNEPANTNDLMLVGFAFELQKLDSIEPQSWDVRLDSVVTEFNIYC